MQNILYDKFGIRYDFKEGTNLKRKNEKGKNLYSFIGSTSDNEFIKLTNIVAYMYQTREYSDQEKEVELRMHKTDKSLFFKDDCLSIRIKDGQNLSLNSSSYNISYFYSYINYVKQQSFSSSVIKYSKGFLFFLDGSMLEIDDITSYDLEKKNENDYTGAIYTKEHTIGFSNAIALVMYTPSDTDDILNLTINSKHIELQGVKKIDLDFCFIDNGDKISQDKLNERMAFNLFYFYKYFNGAWFSKKDRNIVNVDFVNKTGNKAILSL